jgi:uncharacterized membrane-anchored protein
MPFTSSENLRMIKNKESLNFSKVPEVAIGFWIIKIFATTLGEVGGNAVTLTMGLGYLVGTLIFGALLIVAVGSQITAKRFHPYLYWGAITATTLAGTTLADFVDRSLGIGYLGGSVTLFSLVILTLAAWKLALGSVAIETRKVECFYWATIMFSQTLGTALGDWMADSSGLGYNGSALLIAVVLVALAGLYYFTKVSHTFLFWAAFILTRPLGATLANSFDKPIEKGGLGVSDITATLVLAVLMVACLFIIPQRSVDHSRIRSKAV